MLRSGPQLQENRRIVDKYHLLGIAKENSFVFDQVKRKSVLVGFTMITVRIEVIWTLVHILYGKNT